MTCFMAAKRGYLDVLENAHENGCPWDESTCAAAASKGHIAILKYAHTNGCPWDASACALIAVKQRHPHVYAWILNVRSKDAMSYWRQPNVFPWNRT